MSVYVTLLPEAIPDRDRDEDRELLAMSYEDQPGAGLYKYEVLPSGALMVWRTFPDSSAAPEATFGPSAWSHVRGTFFGSND
jgi:hypothetical protein